MKYFDFITKLEEMIQKIKSEEEQASIQAAAKVIGDSVMAGGILQAFGGGHSRASAIEICGRAGGLIPAKIISNTTEGFIEKVEGVGKAWTRVMDLQPEDCLILISNSGNTPFGIELAQFAKTKGVKVILVTSKIEAVDTISKHSSGDRLLDLADVVLDNYSEHGDAVMDVEDLAVKVGPTSSITNAIVLECAIYEAILYMQAKGFTVPIYMSANVEGGREFNDQYEAKYASRIHRAY